jgi:heat shock protein HslJ
MMVRLAWFLAAAAILPGCAQPPAGTNPSSRPPQPQLLETYWRPVEIEGTPFSPRPGVREPHLVLSGQGNQVRGFTGCNNLAGGFELDRDSLRFKPLATTRMACLPQSDLETRFLSAINATVSQRITGELLELRDGKGKVRMRLEARSVR